MDVRASQDTLIDVFERMENFFQRLEIYTNVSPTPEMTDIIVKIMVEMLSILAITTKEMKQSRTSKLSLCSYVARLTEKCLGKYLKKLIGRTDLEDALKRLERLTNEEARMATAQVLKATHAVDDKVGRVEDKVLDVDDRVAGVNDSVARVDERVVGVDDRVARVADGVAGVDDRVAHIDERVANVDDCVKAIDDKVAVVIDGEQLSLISRQENIFNIPICPDGKETRVVIQQIADNMDQVKSLSFSFCVDIGVCANASLQGINYGRTFADGSLRRIPLLTTTLPAAPIASKQRTGFSKEASSPNGNPMAYFCGSTENVRASDLLRADGR